MNSPDLTQTIAEHGQAPIDRALAAPLTPGAAQMPPPQGRTGTGKRINMNDVAPESVSWLWGGRIARGKFTLIDGDPGEGKSLLTIDVAARVSTGQPLPDDPVASAEPGKVLFLLCEDDLADTVSPRLIAAGADRRQIEVLPGLLKFPSQLDVLESEIAELGASLVIIDPLNGYIDGKVNTHNDHQVRSALTPLVELAARRKVAIVGVRHLNKQMGGPAKYRGGGSIAYTGLARSVLMVGVDPEDESARILAVSKGNLSQRPPSLRFAIVETADKQPRIDWRGPCAITADELCALADATDSQGARRDARDFLAEQLAGGERPAEEIYSAAEKQGIARRTLRRAKRDLDLEDRRDGRVWLWRLPSEPQAMRSQPGAR